MPTFWIYLLFVSSYNFRFSKFWCSILDLFIYSQVPFSFYNLQVLVSFRCGWVVFNRGLHGPTSYSPARPILQAQIKSPSRIWPGPTRGPLHLCVAYSDYSGLGLGDTRNFSHDMYRGKISRYSIYRDTIFSKQQILGNKWFFKSLVTVATHWIQCTWQFCKQP